MANRRFNGEIAKKILLAVGGIAAAGTLTAALIVMPGLGLVAKEILDWYEKQNYKKRYQIRRVFSQLQRKRLIEERNLPDGSTTLVLSEKGKRTTLRFNFDDLKIAKPEKWDGKWRLVIFDFPQKYTKEREAFRSKLKIMGFQQLQKSVWIFPYPCRQEIEFTAEFLRVGRHVRIVEAINFDGSDEIKDFFF